MINIERIYTNESSVINTDTFDRLHFARVCSTTDKLKDAVETMAEMTLSNVSLMGDMWASLYKMAPEMKSNEPKDSGGEFDRNINQRTTSMNEEIIKRVIENTEYNKIRNITKLDDFNSAMGTIFLSEVVSKWLKELRKQDEMFNDALNQLKQLIKQSMANDDSIAQREEKGQTPTKKQQEKKVNLPNEIDNIQKDIASMLNQRLNDTNVISDLISEAAQAVNNSKNDVKSLLGEGADDGDGELKKLPLKDQIELAYVLKDNDNLKSIAEWAGKFKAIAKKKQKVRYKDSHDRSGITFGSDIERLLPQELAQFKKKETKLDFLRRFTEGETMMFSPKGKEVLGKGPIVICLDESGSMHKQINEAKGFTLALAMIAKKQKRDFCVIPFSNKPGEKVVCEKGKVMTEHIMELAINFLGGGTQYMNVLQEAMDYIVGNQRMKKADIIFVTDGDPVDIGSIKKDMPTFIKNKEKYEINIVSLLIGKKVNNKHVNLFSDSVINADSFMTDEANEIFKI